MKAQFFALLGARIVSGGLQAISFVLLARWAGVQDFGLIAIITGVGAIVFAVADWGLSSYIPRVRAKGLDGEVVTGLRLNFFGNIVGGILFAIVLAISAGINGLSPWLCLIPLGLAMDQFTEAGLTVSVADKSKLVAVVSVLVRRSLALVLLCSLYAAGTSVVAAYCIGLLTAAAAGLLHISTDLHRRMKDVADRSDPKALYRALAPYFVANISSQVRTFDVAIVGAVVSVGSAGLYSAAFRLVNPLMVVSSSVVAVVLPHAARLQLPSARQLGRRLTAVTLLSGVPLAATIPFSGDIVVFLFGNEFAGAAPAFAWALVAIPFISLAAPMGGVLQSQGYASFVAINGTVFAAANLLAVLLGSILWGPVGAAGGVALSYACKSASLYVRLATANSGAGRHIARKESSSVAV